MADGQPDFDFPAQLQYGTLSAKHDGWCGPYLRRLRAFYKGGKELLHCSEILADVFPQHRDEAKQVYDERKKRAFYLPYAGEILNFIVASVSAEQIAMKLARESGTSSDPPVPDWYQKWFQDVSPPGGKKVPLHDFVKAAVLDALVCRVSWARADLPKPGQYATQKDQEDAGALNAFVVPIPADAVIDWEEDESGELQFVVVHTTEAKRTSLAAGRDKVTEVFRIYTAKASARYEIEREKDKEVDRKTLVSMKDKPTPHSFGRVPIFRLDVEDGMWAMDNIEGLCRELFNKCCALSWAEFQSLFQELYAFLGPEQSSGGTVIGQSQEDPDRAINQKRGQGYIQVLGKEDKVEFVGPDPTSFAEARQSIADLRTEIHRVTHLMALAADNSAAALRRSADSKGQDKASAVVVFEALGQKARKFAEDIANMVSRGRDDKELIDRWQATGMAKFDAISVDAAVKQGTDLELIRIPSPTFHRLYKLSLCKQVLGDEATPEDLEAIATELEENITAESLAGAGDPKIPNVEDDDSEDDDSEDVPPKDGEPSDGKSNGKQRGKKSEPED